MDKAGGNGKKHGGLGARRAVIRWAVRLFRRELRQQLLILGLVTVSVTAAVAGAAVAYGATSTREAEFGAARERVYLESDDREAMEERIASADDHFGTIDVIVHHHALVPGLQDPLELRAQDPNGPYSGPMLDLRDGRYPSGEGEMALTDEVATVLDASVGDRVDFHDRSWDVVGLVENPGDLGDEFALVSPDDPPSLENVTILFGSDAERSLSWPVDGRVQETWFERDEAEKSAAALSVLLVSTIVLLLVALVASAGFVVLAQRRQRHIGLLAATGATDRHLRLVMLANGAAVGVAAAVVGVLAGFAIWVAVAPRIEAAAGHRIGRFEVPWWILVAGAVLAVVCATAASWLPARTVARLPVAAALSGRPPVPKPARRTAIPAIVLLTIGAGAIIWANPYWYLGHELTMPSRDAGVIVGIVAIALGSLLVCPLAVRLAAAAAGRLPLAPRLALRDLSRYRARSGAALAAISLALGIPIIIVLLTATSAKQSDEGNLSDRQILVRAGHLDEIQAPRLPEIRTDVDEMEAAVRAFAASLDEAAVVPLEFAFDPSYETLPGEDRPTIDLGKRIDNGYRDVLAYVATRQVLDLYGIDPAGIPAGTQILTVETEELTFLGSSDRTTWVVAEHAERLPTPPYTSAPTTLITEEAIRDFGWETTRAGWVVESARSLTGDQISAARTMAAAGEMTIETRRDYDNPSLRMFSIGGGMLLALAIVAMTVGLIRSEAADDLRTLAATGASSRIRRALTASTAGALGLLGVLVGGFGAYLGLVSGYLREPSHLGRVPVMDLLVIGVGVPLLAAAAGWLLGGREPASLLRPRVPMSSIVLVLALVVAAACGGSDDDDGETGRADLDERDPLPLQEWEDAILGTGEDIRAQERRVEQHIADCMVAQGFEYVVVEPHPGQTLDASGESPWGLPAGGFAERYGYGLFTIDDPALADPNAPIVAAMPESQREAYRRALEGSGDSGEVSGPADGGESGPAEGGEEPVEDEVVEDEPVEEAPLGCMDQAWEQELETATFTSDDFAGLNEDLEALFEREESDPRIEDEAREWAGCMADEDADYADFEIPDDALSSVVDRFAEEVGEIPSGVGLESVEIEGSSRQVHRLRGVDFATLDPAVRQTMRDYEIAVATADHECRGDYDEVQYEVRFEYEDEFVEQHRAELERLRDAIAAESGTP